MLMLAVILGSTLYSTTLLIASTLLPQMQGTMGATPDEIAWNFEKFIVSRGGDVVARLAPTVTPEDPELTAIIDAELAKA